MEIKRTKGSSSFTDILTLFPVDSFGQVTSKFPKGLQLLTSSFQFVSG